MRNTGLIDDLVEQTPDGDSFYTVPDPLPEGVYGEVIYLRPLENMLSVPEGGESWLVLYRSESAGTSPAPVATSGIIVLPDKSRHPVPPGGYPLVSWCHGTVGAANVVAPSRDPGGTGASPMNAYPTTLLSRFLDRGWAVAMTDYEALGTGTGYVAPGNTGGLHPYLLGQSEARAALDIVLAARHLFGDEISSRFALVGHSQGGQAALFAAANAAGRVDGLVSVAAIAPANHPLDLVKAGASPLNVFTSDGYAFTALFLAGAIGGSIADAAAGETVEGRPVKVIDPEQVLSAAAFGFWPEVWNLSRADLGDGLFGGLAGNAQFRRKPPAIIPSYPADPNPDQQEFDRQLTKMNPDLDIPVPVRISQAVTDQRVQYEPEPPLPQLTILGTKALIKELSDREGNDIAERIYLEYEVKDDGPLGAHFATIDADTDELIDWLVERGLEQLPAAE